MSVNASVWLSIEASPWRLGKECQLDHAPGPCRDFRLQRLGVLGRVGKVSGPQDRMIGGGIQMNADMNVITAVFDRAVEQQICIEPCQRLIAVRAAQRRTVFG